MVAAGVNPADVNHIFLSHLHYDHIADAYFMITTWMANRQTPPIVVGPQDTKHFVHALLDADDGAFRKDIEARVQYKQRQDNFHVLTPDVREKKRVRFSKTITSRFRPATSNTSRWRFRPASVFAWTRLTANPSCSQAIRRRATGSLSWPRARISNPRVYVSNLRNRIPVQSGHRHLGAYQSH